MSLWNIGGGGILVAYVPRVNIVIYSHKSSQQLGKQPIFSRSKSGRTHIDHRSIATSFAMLKWCKRFVTELCRG